MWSIGLKDRLSWRSRVQMRWSYFVLRRSRLAQAIVILFTEYFYRCSGYTRRDHPQIYPSQPPLGVDPAFSLRSLECGSLATWRHSGLVSRLALSRERGMVAVLCVPTLSLHSPCFSRMPRGLTLRSLSRGRTNRHGVDNSVLCT